MTEINRYSIFFEQYMESIRDVGSFIYEGEQYPLGNVDEVYLNGIIIETVRANIAALGNSSPSAKERASIAQKYFLHHMLDEDERVVLWSILKFHEVAQNGPVESIGYAKPLIMNMLMQLSPDTEVVERVGPAICR